MAIGLGCWWLWCVALMHRTWYTRHGYARALRLSLARLVRERSTHWLALLGLAGSAAIAGVWVLGAARWAALLSALVGMAAGGGLIWIVRIVGSKALGREAMGFGDVILVSMIGAFLGWQSCLIVFFLAPVAGLVLGVLMLIFRHDNEIPYGPFLCLAAATVVVAWASVWQWTSDRLFILGKMVPLIMLVCIVLLALMLGAWRLIKSARSAK